MGFRPFVLRSARELGLAGTVANGPAGVEIHVEGPPSELERFAALILGSPPPAAIVERLERSPASRTRASDFQIVSSRAAGASPLSVGPDLATCARCLTELFDEDDRRYRYPFLNCVDCGPRYTIVTGLPYDRARTTMSGFSMCPQCRSEYGDSDDRRFHAQPNACAHCGPRLHWIDGDEQATAERALERATQALAAGRIVAVQGLGGFHVMVRADATAALRELRERKRRGAKPFAVMFRDVAHVEKHLAAPGLSEEEAALLRSPAAPIVLVRSATTPELSIEIAPGSPDLGCMLAYTPLHHLLLRSSDAPLVATSGNRRDEPICTSPEQAQESLSDLVDAYLLHDRPIQRAVDDSVTRVVDGRTQILRRARGYAPLSFEWEALPDTGIDLALGPHQKATVGVRVGKRITVSPHIGDLETIEARDAHESAVRDMESLVGVHADRIVCDLHPEYASSVLAERLADDRGTNPIRVQHHHAHLLAGALEHGLTRDFLGIVWDGTGLGLDGTTWGGEFFVHSSGRAERVGSLSPFPLPGGDRAVRQPWRAALGLLESTFDGVPPASLTREPMRAARLHGATMWENLSRHARGSASRTSSVGRTFDAVAAILGLVQSSVFEAEAPQSLEAAAVRHHGPASSYPIQIDVETDRNSAPWRLLAQPWLQALAEDLEAGTALETLAARFHATLARMIELCAIRVGLTDVVLTGGCFQNRLLLELTIESLRRRGMRPHWAQRIPPGDGGIAAGQLVAASRV